MTCKGIINKTIWGYSLLRTGIPFTKQPKEKESKKKRKKYTTRKVKKKESIQHLKKRIARRR